MLTDQGRAIENDWTRRTQEVWGGYEGRVISASTRPEVIDYEPTHRYAESPSKIVERIVVKEPEVEKVVVQEPVTERVVEQEPVKVVEKVVQPSETPAETTKTVVHSTS